MVYFIVEHPSRGCLISREVGWAKAGTRVVMRHKFSWTIYRTDLKVIKYTTAEKAWEVAKEAKGAYVLQVGPEVKPGEYREYISYVKGAREDGKMAGK